MCGLRQLTGAFRLAAATLLLAACQDDLPQATEITHMRILGSRLQVVDGDELTARSTPHPGERIHVSFETVFPTLEGTTDDVQTLVINCTAPERFTGGLPLCQEFLDAATGDGADVGMALEMLGEADKVHCDEFPRPQQQLGTLGYQCVDGPPEIEFRITEDFAAEEALFLGVVCERGRAFIDPNDPTLFGCDDLDGGEAIRVHGLVPVARDDDEDNENPSFDGVSISREASGVSQPWPVYDPSANVPEDNCSGVSDESVLQGDRLAGAIQIELDADDRETFEGEPEELEFSVYATRPELERRFTLFPSDAPIEDGKLRAELEWEADEDEEFSAGGTLVRFYFTVLDRRGGFDITARAMCVP